MDLALLAALALTTTACAPVHMRSMATPCAADGRRARRISAVNRGEEIRFAAEALSLHAVYVPSMRNGIDCAEEPREDRGNAILSTLPLSDIAAIELPFAQQRRVAVAATVRLGHFALRVVSVHLDTLWGHRRQADGLIKALDQLPLSDGLIVAGDLNEVRRGGVNKLRKHLAETDCGHLPTHDFPRCASITCSRAAWRRRFRVSPREARMDRTTGR